MEKVKFINKDKTQFLATVRRRVNDYFNENKTSADGNHAVIFKTIIVLSLFLFPFFVVISTPIGFLSMLMLSVLMGVGMAATGMCVTHDALHGSLFSKNWLNKLLGYSMYLIGGNVFNWKVHHNILHHTFTNIYGLDEDIRLKGFLRLSTSAPKYKIHSFQHVYGFFFYSLTSLFQMVEDLPQLYKFNKSGLTQRLRAKPASEFFIAVSTKAFCLFIFIGLPILLTSFSGLQVLFGFLLMHLTTGLIFGIVFQLAHIVEGSEQPVLNIDGNIENEWAIHQLYTSSNFSNNNRILCWFLGGLNFQIEHHLFPKICHVHFREIAGIVEKTAIEFGLPYNKKSSLREAIISHARTLKTLGTKTSEQVKFT